MIKCKRGLSSSSSFFFLLLLLFNSLRGSFDVDSFPRIVLAQIADDCPHVGFVQDGEIATGLGE